VGARTAAGKLPNRRTAGNLRLRRRGSRRSGPRMQCSVCQWIYDPELGEPLQDVAPGTPWSDVPDNFLCPECSLGKDVFDELGTEAK
jgi:rubredoxin